MKIAIAFALLFSWWLNSQAYAGENASPEKLPWDLKSLRQPPRFAWTNRQDTVWSLEYQGPPFQQLPTTQVFAYYATPGTLARDPARDKNLPGMVLVHGGGGTAYKEWVELWARRGYAAIAMDLYGSTPEQKRLDRGGPPNGGLVFADANAPVIDQWPYHAVANVIAAHSLLLSFPEIDPQRTGITGISWGGFFTCVVAGLDDRFKVAIPVYGCGFIQEHSDWQGVLENLSPRGRNLWIQRYDPSSYLARIRLPMLFLTGTNDPAYPLDIHAKTCQSLKNPPLLSLRIAMPHGHTPGWAPPEIGWFADQYLKGGTALPQIGIEKIAGTSIEAPVQAQTRLLSASLNYTMDKVDPIKRQWQTAPASIDKGTIRATLPAGVTAWYLSVIDERQALVSGPVHFLP